MRAWRRGAVGLALLALAGLPWGTDAGAATPNRFVTGWVPVWSSSASSEGLRGVTGGTEAVFVEVSPFAFEAKGTTTIALSGTEATLTAALNALRANKLPVVPSITDGTARLVMAGILADPVTRTQHVDAIVNLVTTRNFDGIDLDYEGFAFVDGRSSWATTRPNWAAFVQELGAKLRAQGKVLSMTVPPIWNGGSSGYTVYAWPETLPHIDRLRLMVYDWSVTTAGPIAPISWVNDVVAHVKAVVPAAQLRKVQLGVPTYGRNWAKVQSGTCPTGTNLATTSVQMEHAAALAASKGVVPTRHSSGEITFTYTETFTGPRPNSIPPPPYTPPVTDVDQVGAAAPHDGLDRALRLSPGGAFVTCVVTRTVFHPDEFAVLQRVDAAVAGGLSGIAIWALGYETTALWPLLAGVDVPRPAGTAPIGWLDSAARIGDGTAGVTVSGWALDPEFDLPITVRITVTDPGQPTRTSGPILARSLRPDLAAAIPGAGTLHGLAGVVVPLAAAPGAQVCLVATGYGAAASSAVPLGPCRTV
jgi:spore germination protein YaaH